jgi:hypothetical protein
MNKFEIIGAFKADRQGEMFKIRFWLQNGINFAGQFLPISSMVAGKTKESHAVRHGGPFLIMNKVLLVQFHHATPT